MAEFSALFVLGTLATYLIAMVCFAVDISALGGHAPGRTARKAAGIGLALTWLGAGLHLAALLLRAFAAGRVPWANMYEFTLTFTFVAVATFLGIQRRRDVRYLGVLVTFVAVVALALAELTLWVPADGVQPALDSYWLAIHVSVAAATTGVFSVAAAASVLQLLQHRQSRSVAAREPALVGAGAIDAEIGESGVAEVGESAADRAGADDGGSGVGRTSDGFFGRLMAQLPSAQSLERFAYRLNAVAFVGWTFTVVAGAIWAEHAWGRPWGWDPKETWSLVIWLIYAAYLHMRATVGWTINRFAWFGLIGFVALLANFYIVNIFFQGKHSYSGL